MRVLIVDDNASMRSMLSALLGGHGHEVVAVLEDGNEIMATIRRTSPDLVCLDYPLPGRDGLEILHEINEAASEIDVVFMTAWEDASIEGKAADAGASGFLRKHFSQSQIIGELRQVCANRLQARAANEKSASMPGKDLPGTAGAKGYIVKPIRPAYLDACIRKLLKHDVTTETAK
jgi:DNA-binding response OmpR family regulator